MLRSMYSGVSGLRGHQTMMDVVGNNIANVNTAGFKSSQTVFQDLLTQVLQGAAPAEGAGGTNPAQVGLGMRLAGIMTSFTQGGLQNTGRSTDLSIQGDGFFAVRTANETLYTRAGAFSFDAGGRLVTPQGAVVQGWTAAADGTINTNAPVGDIVMPVGQLIDPLATTQIELGGNLPSEWDAANPSTIRSSITVYDARGTAVPVALTFTQTGSGAWNVEATSDGAPLGSLAITFGADGQLDPPGQGPVVLTMPDGSTIDAVLGAAGQPLTQFASLNNVAALSQNGSAAGSLQSFSISPDGVIVGVFTNGRNQQLGQVAVTGFNNPAGLEKVGGSTFRPTVNSGVQQLGVAGEGGRGLLAGGTLEMSNVDLAQEFTNLIVAQRGFQANSRVITSSDELLQELVNMKR